MTQKEAILKHLEEFGSITPLEALSEAGCLRLASVVCKLRKAGVPIQTTTVTHKGRYRTSRYAKYTLEKQ